jgi:hypothetical protein
MGDSGGSTEDWNADRNVDNKNHADGVSYGDWTKGHSCYILEKNLFYILPMP